MDFESVFRSVLRDTRGGEFSIEGDELVSVNGERIPVVNGIPRFAGQFDTGQEQVEKTFAYKWNRSPEWGIHDETSRVMTEWVMPVLGWADEEEYARYLSRAKVILDAGCGNGREAIRMARLNPDALVIGLDISNAVDQAQKNAEGIENLRFVQGDLCLPPLAPSSIDYVFSFGVLHHTPNTKVAFSALAPLVKPGGEFAFYVYRKKAPIREFSDDYVRQQVRNMSPEDAWAEMENYALLGKALSDLQGSIEIPEIKTLGMHGGKHDVQRLLYYTVVKCYWRDGWTLEENTHINFDWFYPEYSWRHTIEEIRGWFSDVGFLETSLVEIPAGLTFRITPK